MESKIESIQAINAYKAGFTNRNRFVYIIAGLLCVLTGFLRFFSFSINVNGWTYSFFLRAIDTFSDLNTINSATSGIDGLFIRILFYFPLYIMILGVYYFLRGVLLSYSAEKRNVIVFKTIAWVTMVFFGVWFLAAAAFGGIMGVTNWSQILNFFTKNLHPGFYIFCGVQIMKERLKHDLIEDTHFKEVIKKVETVFAENASESDDEEDEDDKESTYYIHDGTAQHGPFSIIQLKAVANKNFFVWAEGMEDWTPITKVAELKTLFEKQPPPFLKSSQTKLTPPVFTKDKTISSPD